MAFLTFNKGSFVKYEWPLMNYFSSQVLVLLESSLLDCELNS